MEQELYQRYLFLIETLLQILILIYLFYIKNIKVKETLMGIFKSISRKSLISKNHTFDAFLSQTSSTPAGGYLSV